MCAKNGLSSHMMKNWIDFRKGERRMGFFILMVGLIILGVVINILKKESPNNDRSAKSHSNHSGTHVDYSSTSTFVSAENSNTHNCSDSASSFNDTSSCSDSGSSSSD